MIDTTTSFIAWGIITFVFAILASCVYMWLSNVSRFENRRKEIALGMIVCIFVISSFFFLPVLFSRINLNEICSNIHDAIEAKSAEVLGTNKKLSLPPFINSFSKIMKDIPQKWILVILWGIPSLCSVLIVSFVIRILFLLRESKTIIENEYTRKHLFEYNETIVTNLNKKK